MISNQTGDAVDLSAYDIDAAGSVHDTYEYVWKELCKDTQFVHMLKLIQPLKLKDLIEQPCVRSLMKMSPMLRKHINAFSTSFGRTEKVILLCQDEVISQEQTMSIGVNWKQRLRVNWKDLHATSHAICEALNDSMPSRRYYLIKRTVSLSNIEQHVPAIIGGTYYCFDVESVETSTSACTYFSGAASLTFMI